jgi:hypothetical protein
MKIELPFSGNLTFDLGSILWYVNGGNVEKTKIEHLNLSSYMIG